jgi:Tol biopolymer transport system component/tetratricopeptide (TPR) repeat protein
MVQDQEKPEEAIFKVAVQHQDRRERQAYVVEACGGDRRLLADVEALLQYHDSSSFLDAPVFDPDVRLDGPVVTEGPGTVIGRYKLLEKIGEGGMAVVYMAEQTEPLRRKVALKIIKLGMDTRQVIARFEAERQALALMDHPNIAKVLDAGATETGRPYFVMELVTGVSITEYCDKNSLSTKDRLALFLQVCHAVQHAHQKGIIHRDIKPSNVMVTHHDGKPVPKVIDFGIAKATNQKLTEKTLFTRYAHLIGTPAYMSPEQAELSDLDIDTRSDIYSLGVLLYELLTGTTPFSEEELRKAGYTEMQRVIREQEPVKPSTKLSTLGGTLTDIAKCRNATPDLLRKAIRGDLDWIVMKSLEKDRARRYETASGLAEDIRRHLESEPVLARGPTAAYRLGKFLRRHRFQVLAAAVLAVFAGTAGIVFALWNQDRLRLAEVADKDILFRAQEQYAKGERQAALETTQRILQSQHVGPDARLLCASIRAEDRRSDEAIAMLGSLLEDRPAIAGAAHALLARILWESGPLDAAKLREIDEHRQQAVALLPETAEAYFQRAMTAVTIKEQLAALDRALQLDSNHYESRRLRAFTYYASRKYEEMEHDAIVLAVLRPRDPLGHSLRAVALRELGKLRGAIAEYDEAMTLIPRQDPPYLDLAAQRCETFLRLGDYARIVSEARACLELSPNASPSQYHLFCGLTALGDYDGAAALFRQIAHAGQKSRLQFRDWCAKYVFDTLAAGRFWHPADRAPAGAAFLPLVEAEQMYRVLSARGRRLTTDGFSAQWSPDGKKLAFSAGVHGYSGVAVYDLATNQTDLLVFPGKDPRWSPDGKYIAFARDPRFLRIAELLGAERREQRLLEDEEVWLMRSDGTEPRRLARGSWPCWSPDSTCLYYRSYTDQTLSSISITGQDAPYRPIMLCPYSYASVSPDNRRVAYFDEGVLRVRELPSKTQVIECPMPFAAWADTFWSPTGRELYLGGGADYLGGGGPAREAIGLWTYDLDARELRCLLRGQIRSACRSPQGTNLAFCLGPPYYEIWTADLDPNRPALASFGSGQTPAEHARDMVGLWTRRIEADPADPNNYRYRARQHQFLREEANMRADLRRQQALINQRRPPPIRPGGPWTLARAIDGPSGYQLVVFAERQDSGMYVLRLAFGQRGAQEMKPWEVPLPAVSLLGLGLLSGPKTPAAQINFTFGPPQNLGPGVNSPYDESGASISADGLTLYFASDRPGGFGGWDLWVSTRPSRDAAWEPAVNLGLPVNSPYDEIEPCISADGLSLYFSEPYITAFGRLRPNGLNPNANIWMTTRLNVKAAWGTPVNLGPSINSYGAFDPSISPDGLSLYFGSFWPGSPTGRCSIMVATRSSAADPFGNPIYLGILASTYAFCPSISASGRVLFFTQWGGPAVAPDLWVTTRTTASGEFGPLTRLSASINTYSYSPCVSADGSTLYFTSGSKAFDGRGLPGGQGGADLWQASILPITDPHGGAKVDAN